MAKIIKKPADREKKREANSRNASGAGYRRTFSETEREEITRKRREMRERLYAAG